MGGALGTNPTRALPARICRAAVRGGKSADSSASARPRRVMGGCRGGQSGGWIAALVLHSWPAGHLPARQPVATSEIF